MNSIDATSRETKTKGQLNTLRKNGEVPAVIYGGKEENQKISLQKKEVKNLIEKDNFLSNVISLKLNGKEYNVLPRDIVFDTVSDEPVHVDFLRITKGATIVLEIPVKFINNELSPGLKRGGVLNIVRRKVELRCPTDNIPTELVVDLDNLDIGASIKISSVKLPENVYPTIQGRDFVIATVAAPTIVKEPEKPAEETAEGAEGAEGAAEGAAEGTSDAAKEGSGDKPAEGEKAKEEDKKAQVEKK